MKCPVWAARSGSHDRTACPPSLFRLPPTQ